MITILHVTPAYKPAYIYGGPTFSVSRLCEELGKTTLDIKVLTTNANGIKDLDVETGKAVKIANVQVQYCKRLTKDHTHLSPALMKELISMIKTCKADPAQQIVIHIHSWWNTVALAAAIISLVYRIPVVISPRGMLTTYSLKNRHTLIKKLIHTLVGKPLLKRCFLHATTDQELNDLLQIGVNPKKVHIIPNLPTFIAHHHKQQELVKTDSKLKILFLSRIEEKKGLDLLFEALSLLKIKWQLTIAGEGDTEYVNQLTFRSIKLNIHRNIYWIDGVYNAAKFECMQQHDLLILPSHNENFANVVLESLSVGTPVIISNKVGLANYVLQSNLGWICTTEPKHIASTIELAVNDKSKLKRIRKEAPKIIAKDFQEKKLISSYVSMYEEMLKYEF